MKAFVTNLIAVITRLLLWLRYRIEVTGLDQIKTDKGVLFLPNHPGEMDPVIMASLLWRRFQPRPMAVEDFVYMTGLKWLFRLLGAIPMPNMEGGIGSYKRIRVAHALDAAAQHLRDGENLLIYPAGRLMRDNREDLRATTAVKDMLERCPEVTIVMVRQRGLLGSSFSWMAHRTRPHLFRGFLHAAKWVLVNLVVFMPRRRVTIEFQAAPDDFPRAGDKMAINRYLEAYYNAPGPEALVAVSYCRWWTHCIPFVPKPESDGGGDQVDVPPEIRETVQAYLRKITSQPDASFADLTPLQSGVGLDSLSLADLVSWLDEEFHAADIDPEDLHTVGDALRAAAGTLHGAGATTDAVPEAPEGWVEADRGTLQLPPCDDPATTVPIAFLRCAERLDGAVAAADEVSGVLTYHRLKVGVLLMAEHFRTYPEQRVGVMLPASVGAGVVSLALLVAGKTPVMVNWTLGDANFAHVLKTAELRRIITSAAFLDKVDGLPMDLIFQYIETLEDLRKQHFRLGAKLRALLLARKSADALIARYDLRRAGLDDPTVILFTSGSESAPKGVPLTHRNVLANVAGSAAVLQDQAHTLFGFLPPFHSFGFTITTILPLTTGMKVAYHPNPTQSRRLARGCAVYRPTIICGTPTFVAGIMKAAGPGQLDSLRYIVTGAEKTPDALYREVSEMGVQLLEGYGITELSPCLTLNRPGEPPVGVGRPIDRMRITIVDPETREPLPQGERGLILAQGPCVFPGYLGRDSSDAFHQMDGETWYVTGDLGFVDAHGSLTLSGRLKRFVKVGGEMISLPAMEAALAEHHPPSEDGAPAFAITAVEPEGARPVMAAFITFDATVEQLNGILRDAGMGNLARVKKAIRLDAIPQIGTGKTDYRSLKTLLEQAIDGSDMEPDADADAAAEDSAAPEA